MEPRRIEVRMALGAAGGVAAGMLPTLVVRTPASLLAGMGAAALCVLAAAAPLVRRPTRAAFELYVELLLGSRASALETIGTPLPSTGAAAHGWIRDRGEAATPIALLIETGRLDAARLAIDGLQAGIDAGSVDASVAIWLDLHRQALRLAIGQPVSLDGVGDRFGALGDPRAAQRGLTWLALLEAAAAVAGGQDPMPVLVAGRARLSSVSPLAHAGVLVAGALLLVTAAAALVAGLVLLALGTR